MTAIARVARAGRRRLRRRDRFVTTLDMNGPRIARARLWRRARSQGSLLQLPFRVTGAGAPRAVHAVAIGHRTRIGQLAWFSLVTRDARVVIGDGCTLSTSFSVSVVDRVEIADGTAIGERCLITDHGHDHATYIDPALEGHAPPEFGWDTTEARPVRIGPGVHIGANVYIGPGVTIGEGAVVGVNSVVTRSVPPYTVVAGVPARQIRTLRRTTGGPPCSPT